MLFYGLLVFMSVLNVVDLFLTLGFVRKWGLELEANPVARWVYVKGGPWGMVLFKGFFSFGSVVLLVLAVGSSFSLLGAVVGAIIMTWVVARGFTMVQMLS